jgi:FkbM family methyltransferase
MIPVRRSPITIAAKRALDSEIMTLTRPILTRSTSRVPLLFVHTITVSGWLLAPLNYRLHWRVCNAIAQFAKGKRYEFVISIGDDSRMRISLDDPYWSRLLCASYEYEADFKQALRALSNVDFVVVDCGANFGYWSILLSGSELGSRRVLAVEAAADTYRLLVANCDLNGGRFQCVHGAIDEVSGRRVSIEALNGHSSARVSADGSGSQLATTISLDDLVSSTFDGIPARVLIKLDVEGHEISALRGSARLLASDVLVYYEDHGIDLTSKVTDYVIRELGLRVFFLDRGRLRDVPSAQAASRFKKRTTYGYNFFACKPSSVFVSKLMALA